MKSYLSHKQIEKNGKYFFKCGNCNKLVLTSEAWIDTFDDKQKHFKCLSDKRLKEIEKEIEEEYENLSYSTINRIRIKKNYL